MKTMASLSNRSPKDPRERTRPASGWLRPLTFESLRQGMSLSRRSESRSVGKRSQARFPKIPSSDDNCPSTPQMRGAGQFGASRAGTHGPCVSVAHSLRLWTSGAVQNPTECRNGGPGHLQPAMIIGQRSHDCLRNCFWRDCQLKNSKKEVIIKCWDYLLFPASPVGMISTKNMDSGKLMCLI